jgi:hypothetical protein
VFRLSPEVAKYRVTLKQERAEPVTKDVEVDGAAVIEWRPNGAVSEAVGCGRSVLATLTSFTDS